MKTQTRPEEDAPASADPLDARIETAISTLIFAGGRVWKMRKPVAFPFLDQRTREAQRHLCLREVELNSRLAPSVYLGVVEIDDPDSGDRRPATLMRRLPDSRRLGGLIAASEDTRAEIREIARTIAAFHLSAHCGPAIAAKGAPDVLSSRWHDSLALLDRFAGSVLDAPTLAVVRQLADEYILGRAPLLLRRMASDKIVDGHGDLLADDIFCLEDGPQILDCLEFSDELRYCDVVSDVASLAMDCERLGAPQLGALLLHEYTSYTADLFPSSLADHYIAFRAVIRCEVACLRHEQGADGAVEMARSLLTIAERHSRLAQPTMLLVGGPPGVGKSTVAARLADALGWALIRSDEVRRDVLGTDPWGGSSEWLAARFSPAATSTTYHELLQRATSALERGESVILDATWSSVAHREEAEAAALEGGSRFVALRCDAPTAVTDERVRLRIGAGVDISSATVEVARRMAKSFAPWPGTGRLDTSLPIAETIATALETIRITALRARSERLVAPGGGSAGVPGAPPERLTPVGSRAGDA